MKKIAWLGIVVLLVLFAGCADEKIEVTNKPENNVFVLNEESASALRDGIIKGTSLKLDEVLRLENVRKVWGEPEKEFDHEDIRDYRYLIHGRKVLLTEDEMGSIYVFQIEIGITREEILHYMGEPTEGKKTGRKLIYHDSDYRIAFEKWAEPKEGDKETWELIYYKAAKQE